MNTQPEALRLAEIVDKQSLAWIEGTLPHIERVQTATELRRLHEVNQELVYALRLFLYDPMGNWTESTAEAALAKAQGETK